MEKVRIGLAGAGFVSAIHTASCRENSSLMEITGVCASRAAKAQEFAQRHGIPHVFENYEEMASSPLVDVVDVCVPTHLHESVIKASLEREKHVICEKPLTGYFGEDTKENVRIGDEISKRDMLDKVLSKTRSLEEDLKRSGVKFMYAENFVYAPSVVKIKRMLHTSRSPVIELRAEESHSGSHASYSRWWRTAGGGSLLRMGSHPVGGILHLKHFEGMMREGVPIRAQYVWGETGRLTKMPSVKKEKEHYFFMEWGDVEDWSVITLTFEDGSKAVSFSNDVTLGGVRHTVEVFTSRGVLSASMTHNNSMMAYAPAEHIWGDEYIAEKLETKAGWSFPSPDEDWARGYPQEMKDFALAILQDREPVSGFTLARETAEIIYAAYLSAEEGRRIDLKDSIF